MDRIAFRVDASSQIGTGHFMRCLTLADSLRQYNTSIRFISRQLPEFLRKQLSDRGHEFRLLDSVAGEACSSSPPHARWLGTSQLEDARDSVDALADHTWDLLVVDHYSLDYRWEGMLRNTARKVLAIDDLADRVHDCDALLDQNYYTDMDVRYVGKVPPHCDLMLGPRYALLRDEFRKLHGQAKNRQRPVERALVCFGGLDIGNYTQPAIEALVSIGIPHIDVVIGFLHPYREEIENACVKHGYECHVQTDRMAELMAAADVAIGAGGATIWERCCLGLPAFAICTADNQRSQIKDAAAAGLVYSLEIGGDADKVIQRHLHALVENEALRSAISRKALQAVDGCGVSRALGNMGYVRVSLRRASKDDSRSVFGWRNHPSIRSVSRNTDPISWKGHQEWFTATMASPDQVLLVGQLGSIPVGVVRFVIQDNSAEISIYVVPGHEQVGLGRELLQAAERWFALNYPQIGSLRAHVMGQNRRSCRLFEGLGYQIESTQYSKRLHRDG